MRSTGLMAAAALPQLPAPASTPRRAPSSTHGQRDHLANAGAAIRYTTDGSPNHGGLASLTAPLSLTVIHHPEGQGLRPRLGSDATTTGVYVVRVAAPSISPAGGTYSGVKSVSVSSTTPGAVVRYTTDGTVPTESSTAVGASGTVLLAVSGTLTCGPSHRASKQATRRRRPSSSSERETWHRANAHCLALTPSGQVWAWGANCLTGGWGRETTAGRVLPILVPVSRTCAYRRHRRRTSKHQPRISHVGRSRLRLGRQLPGTALQRHDLWPNSPALMTSGSGRPLAHRRHCGRSMRTRSRWTQTAESGLRSTTPRAARQQRHDPPDARSPHAHRRRHRHRSRSDHSLAIKEVDGSSLGLGLQQQRPVGNGPTPTPSLRPVEGPVRRDRRQRRMAIVLDGSGVDGVPRSGGQRRGQLGDGGSLDQLTPVAVPGPPTTSPSSTQPPAMRSPSLTRASGLGIDARYGTIGDGAARHPNPGGPYSTGLPPCALSTRGILTPSPRRRLAVWAWGSDSWRTRRRHDARHATAVQRPSAYRDRTSPGESNAGHESDPVAATRPRWQVTLDECDAGASLFYSINGAEPATPYTGAISIAPAPSCALERPRRGNPTATSRRRRPTPSRSRRRRSRPTETRVLDRADRLDRLHDGRSVDPLLDRRLRARHAVHCAHPREHEANAQGQGHQDGVDQ